MPREQLARKAEQEDILNLIDELKEAMKHDVKLYTEFGNQMEILREQLMKELGEKFSLQTEEDLNKKLLHRSPLYHRLVGSTVPENRIPVYNPILEEKLRKMVEELLDRKTEGGVS